MPDGMKVLLFSASYGEGHLQACNALEQAFSLENRDNQVWIIDFMHMVHPRLNKVTRSMYLYSIRSTPSLYKRFYKSTNSEGLNKTMHYVGRGKTVQVLQQLQPDAIISTFPHPSAVLSRLRGKGALHIPYATVVTDYILHRQWIHPHTDQYFVAADDLALQLQEKGILPGRISVSGIPVRPAFTQSLKREELLHKYALRPDQPVILLLTGAFGVLPDAQQLCQYLVNQEYPLQLLVVCGKNQELFDTLQQKFPQTRNSVRIFGYVEAVHELMHLSDLVITKAGGMTVSECLAMGKPMLLYRVIPGQEEGNANFLLHHQAAVTADTMEEFHRTIQLLLSRPEKLNFLQQQAQKISKPSASQEIVKRVRLWKQEGETRRPVLSGKR